MASNEIELTILMPCLNEAETLETCIAKAKGYLQHAQISGEILIADNGSTDGSQTIATSLGARVVSIAEKGYGAAIGGGIVAARGKYIIMGDADDSYDFANLHAYVEALRKGNQLVMGNRFKGGVAAGAMPPLHRYIGNPILSFIGRLLFKTKIGDFHCGLRGFDRATILDLNLRTTGMEFASEMVVKATLGDLKIAEVPTTLKPDGRTRSPHLRSFRDGWRHLRFLLLFSPRWLFLYPGMALVGIGLIAIGFLWSGPVQLTQNVRLDVNTLLVAAMSVLVGLQSISFALIGRSFATRYGFIPRSERFGKFLESMSLERILIFSLVLIIGGITGTFWAVNQWAQTGFGDLEYSQIMRPMIISTAALVAGLQTMMTGFLSSMISVPFYERRRTDAIAQTPDISSK